MKSYNKMKISKKYLWSFFILVITIVIIITTMMFAFYSNIQINTAKDYSVAQLEQVCTMMDLLYNSMDSVTNQIIQDKDTYANLGLTTMDRLKELSACAKLRDIQTSFDFMRYISFYNSHTERFLSSSYAGYLDEGDADYYYSLLGEKQNACVFRKIGENYATQSYKNTNVYTFVFKINIRIGDTPDLIIIDVNENYFSSIFNSIRTGDDKQHILLISGDNTIISAQSAVSNRDYFVPISDFTDFDTSELNKYDGYSGAFSYNGANLTNQFVTFSRAHESGITIVNMLPYNSIITGVWQIAMLTFALAGVALIFGYIISRKMSKILYAPIQSLYTSYVSKDPSEKGGNELEALNTAFSDMYSKADQLEQGLISTYNDTRRLYLDHLLKGKEQDAKHSTAVYVRLGIDIASPYYTVILIECESKENGPQTENDVFISHYALENVTREVVSQFGNMDLLRTNENSFAVLLSLTSEKLPENIIEQLNNISTVMLNEFSIETTICIGKVVQSYENINMCYESTRIALGVEGEKHEGKIFVAGTASEPINASQYYNKLHNKIAEYVRADDVDSCSKEFDLALSSMSNVSFQTAKTYFNHVMMTLLDEFSSILERSNDSFVELSQKLDDIMNVTNVKSMKAVMMDFLSLLMHKIVLNKKAGNQDTVEIAKDFIDKNYSNPDLSLRMLADIVGLSPPYFGKVFTSVTTLTFNDYLNNIRMQKAADMLVTSKMAVNQISEAVGILNTNYFYSVFKKRFSITPSAYRQSAKKSDKA